VGKELRARVRSRHFIAVVIAYAAILGGVTVAFLAQHGNDSSDQTTRVGIQIFQALSIFQLFLILLVTPATTAGAISGERQQRTWDLLLVTHQSAFDIVWGKLLAGLAANVLLIFTSLPLLASVFLFGDVAPGEVLQTYAVFLATILLLATISLLVSALSRRPTVSMVISSVISLALGVGLSLIAIYLEARSQITGPTDLGSFASLPPDAPALIPLAQLDPLVALLSVLPNGNGGTLLGDLGSIHHAFGLPLLLPLWVAFAALSVVVTALVLALATLLVRGGLPGPRSRTG
jgi:ABC-type transport system involved in multi-copper enzyme maturation permease subunit